MADDPTEARYRLCPALREYDTMPRAWLPYVMEFHAPDHRSGVVNTDDRGFRASAIPGGVGGVLDNFGPSPGGRGAGLFVGGSVAFGVGASADERTIPSLLNRTSTLAWRNFGGMAISSTQELLFLLFHHGDVPGLERVVFFSGLNELVLACMGVSTGGGYGPIFNLESYGHRMNARRQRGPKILRALRPGPAPQPPPWRPGRPEGATGAVELYRRNLEACKRLCDPLGVEVHFVLQPVVPWLEKEASAEERALWDELDRRTSNTWTTIRDDFDPAQHAWYAGELAAACGALGIPFHDANEAFGGGRLDGEWIFVDRGHLTDRGNEVAAEFLLERGLA